MSKPKGNYDDIRYESVPVSGNSIGPEGNNGHRLRAPSAIMEVEKSLPNYFASIAADAKQMVIIGDFNSP